MATSAAAYRPSVRSSQLRPTVSPWPRIKRRSTSSYQHCARGRARERAPLVRVVVKLTPDRDLSKCARCCNQVTYCRPLNRLQLEQMPAEEIKRRQNEIADYQWHHWKAEKKHECKGGGRGKNGGRGQGG